MLHLLQHYSVFTAHMLFSCSSYIPGPSKSLRCSCWQWNYGKNAAMCPDRRYFFRFVVLVVPGCLIVVLFRFWKHAELLVWWDIHKIHNVKALDSSHVALLYGLTAQSSAAPSSPAETNTTQKPHSRLPTGLVAERRSNRRLLKTDK